MKQAKTYSKKLLAVLLAMMTFVSCMAVAASAADPLYTLNASNCALNVEKKWILVDPATVTIDGEAKEVSFSIFPVAEKDELKTGETKFFGLESGKTYTVVGKVDDVVVTNEYQIKLKNSQNAPAEPVPTLTATSITVTPIAGGEYKLETFDGTLIQNWAKNSDFKNLTPNTKYTLYVRYAETVSAYASEPRTIVVSTLKSGAGKPAIPVLKDKTNNMISVVAEPGMEYSLDKKNWTVTGEFTGLQQNKAYTVYARRQYDPALQEESLISDPAQITTNAKARFEANIADAKFEVTSSGRVYANRNFTFKITGVTNADQGALQYGDTRYVPMYLNNPQTNEEIPLSPAGVIATGATHSTKKGDLNLTIRFEQQRYINGTWVSTGKVENKVVVVSSDGTYNPIRVVLDFLLDTLPAKIAELFGNETFRNLFSTMIKAFNALIGAAAKMQ